MIFVIAGYNEDEAYGRIYEIKVPSSPTPMEQLTGDFGIHWGGQSQYINRLIHGCDPQFVDVVSQILNLDKDDRAKLSQGLTQSLGLQIPFQFLPLQDCVDVSAFLIEMTASVQNWAVGLRGVGGAIDVATITRTDGFTTIKQKKISLD